MNDRHSCSGDGRENRTRLTDSPTANSTLLAAWSSCFSCSVWQTAPGRAAFAFTLRAAQRGMVCTCNASDLPSSDTTVTVRAPYRLSRCCVLVAALIAACGRVRADDVQVDAETTLQAYDVNSPATPVVWARRRLTQSLGLGYVKPLAEARPDGRVPSLQLHLRLRLNQEFGNSCTADDQTCFAVVDPARRGSYTPIVDDGYIDLPYAYVETRDGPYGTTLRVGRQLHSSVMGFVRLDGASIRVEPVAWLAFEAAFGALVRRTSFAGTDAFVPSDRPRLALDASERALAPYVEPPVTTWLGAASAELGEERIVRARLTYRALQQQGGWLERRLGLGLASVPAPAIRLDAHGVVDALQPGLIDAQVGVMWLTRDVRARVQLARYEPRFEPTSIWAYFVVAPLWLGTLHATRSWGEHVDSSLGINLRRTELPAGVEHELGFDGTLSAHDARDALTLTGFGWAGGIGPVWGASLSGSHRITLPISVEAEVSLMRIDDPLRAAYAGLSVYELLAAHFALTEETALELALSHAHSRVAGERLSLLVFLHLGAWR